MSSRLKEQWELGWTWTEGSPQGRQTPCREPGLSPSAGAGGHTHAKGTRTPLPKTISHKGTLRPPPSLRLTYPFPWAKKWEKKRVGREGSDLWFQNIPPSTHSPGGDKNQDRNHQGSVEVKEVAFPQSPGPHGHFLFSQASDLCISSHL